MRGLGTEEIVAARATSSSFLDRCMAGITTTCPIKRVSFGQSGGTVQTGAGPINQPRSQLSGAQKASGKRPWLCTRTQMTTASGAHSTQKSMAPLGQESLAAIFYLTRMTSGIRIVPKKSSMVVVTWMMMCSSFHPTTSFSVNSSAKTQRYLKVRQQTSTTRTDRLGTAPIDIACSQSSQ